MPITRDDVEFTSQGATLRGWLYRPPGDGPTAGIVLAHGLSAVREMFLDSYGEAFADAGFTALVYDHFGFGASDGEPRQCPLPSLQMDGYRDAVGWLRRQNPVDPQRIGIWGSSFSGGEVIMLAAQDLPIRCAVAQVPVLGGAGGRNMSDATTAALGDALKSGRPDATIPVATPTPDGVGIMYRDGAYDWFTRVSAERAPRWRNEVLARAFTEPFHPGTALADARVPLLLLLASGETLVPHGPAASLAQTSPNVAVVEIPGNHFDAYEAGFAATSAHAVDWFSRHLAADLG